MRVAVVHSYYASDQPSGENVVVEDQVAALREAGHEVTLISRHTDDHADSPGYRFKAARAVATGAGPSPDRQLRDFRPDVIHLHNTFPNFGTDWLDEWGPRTVATLHNYRTVCASANLFRDGHPCTECLDRPVLPAFHHRCYRGSRAQTLPVALGSRPRGGLRAILGAASHLVVLNAGMAARFSAITATPINVVPNFVTSAPDTPAITTDWAYIGRISPEKGVPPLVRAWADAGKGRLHLFGDGGSRGELERTFPSSTNLVWEGSVERSHLLKRLASFSGLIVPSVVPEALPTVILEALSRGVPLVVSEHVSAAEELVGLDVARLLRFGPGGEVVNLDQALSAVLEGGHALRQRGQRLQRDRFSSTAWLRAMTPIYESVAQRH